MTKCEARRDKQEKKGEKARERNALKADRKQPYGKSAHEDNQIGLYRTHIYK